MAHSFTRSAVAIGQDQIVTITADGFTVTDFDGVPVGPEGYEAYEVAWDASAAPLS